MRSRPISVLPVRKSALIVGTALWWTVACLICHQEHTHPIASLSKALTWLNRLA